MPNLLIYIEARKTLNALRRVARLAARSESVDAGSNSRTMETGNCLGLSADEFAEVMAEARPVTLPV